MSHVDAFGSAFTACPLVAVLRGLTPAEAPAVGDALVEAGFTLLEVPLNSPDPLASIGLLARRLEGRAMVGAGTVLSTRDVGRVADAGGVLVVSPNVDAAVIAETARRGLVSLPGYLTPSEAFVALAAGATALKLFPAEGAAPAMLRAQRAVLPREAVVLAVGGITPDTMRPWREAGANGFGLGSNLYAPGRSAGEVGRAAAAYVAALGDLA